MNRYFTEVDLQREYGVNFARWGMGNATLPEDFIGMHHLPLARGAGKVGPAGGYESFLDISSNGAYSGPAQAAHSLVGPSIAAAAIIALLYWR